MTPMAYAVAPANKPCPVNRKPYAQNSSPRPTELDHFKRLIQFEVDVRELMSIYKSYSISEEVCQVLLTIEEQIYSEVNK